jgi:hypothetical protein
MIAVVLILDDATWLRWLVLASLAVAAENLLALTYKIRNAERGPV